MCEALDDHEGSVSIGGWLITNFGFADDTVVNAEEEEADVLVVHSDTVITRFKMEIKGQRLEAVENYFKYLGSIISNEGSELISRIALTTSALSRLKIIWRDKNI